MSNGVFTSNGAAFAVTGTGTGVAIGVGGFAEDAPGIQANSNTAAGVITGNNTGPGVSAVSNSGPGVLTQSAEGVGLHAVVGPIAPASAGLPIAAIFAEGGANFGVFARADTGTAVTARDPGYSRRGCGG
jgi:hypothetical protein